MGFGRRVGHKGVSQVCMSEVLTWRLDPRGFLIWNIHLDGSMVWRWNRCGSFPDAFFLFSFLNAVFDMFSFTGLDLFLSYPLPKHSQTRKG